MAVEEEVDLEPRRSGRGRIIGAIALVVVIFLLASLRGIVGLYTDYLWYDDLGRAGVWTSILRAQIVLAVVFIALFFVLAWLSLYIADRNAPPLRPPGPEEEVLVRWHETVGRRTGLVRYAIAGIFALFSGSTAASQWNEWILFTNRQSFDIADPVFDEDIGFYVFRLPFLSFVVDWFFFALVIIGVLTAVWYWINGGIRVNTVNRRATPQVKAHVSVLLAFLALFKAVDYWLQRFSLLGSTRGFAQGAFYTDLNASLPAIELLLLISLFSVGLFVANIWRRGWTLPAIAVGLWALVAVVAGGIYPAAIQGLQVRPSEEARERPYIERNISATRAAFGLSDVIVGDFAYTGRIDTDRLADFTDVFSNVRLLDPRIVDDSFTLIQRDRDVYRPFAQKVDVDRYMLGGELTPVVVGVRQLGTGITDSWERQHAVQTHGYGVVLAPANRFNANGRPDFVVRDAPLRSDVPELSVNEPQIYFGDGRIDYALTKTTQTEFDFNAGFSYDGAGGLPMNTFWRRLAFAVRFGEIEPLISGTLTDETEVLFIRDVTDRARRVAPFLHFDSNPYPVIVDEGVSWVIDAYTTSNMYPYSQRAPVNNLPLDADLRHNFNYVRNSVKVVVDAYDGTVELYVVDTDDPILQAYRQAFEGLFQSIDEMPPVIRDHLRYPEDLFRVQTEHWGLYQLEDVSQFFTPNFGWNVALNNDAVTDGQATVQVERSSADSGSSRVVPVANRFVDPYYQVTRLPDETETSFVLTRPFVPRSSEGTIRELTAYFVARTDADGGHELRQYVMTTDNNVSVRGPTNINDDLNADPTISEESTELGRGGSQFLSGNLMILLVDEAVVYVRPFYVRSQPENAQDTTEPLIEFVAVVLNDRIGFEPTYAGALAEVFQIPLAEAAALAGTGVPVEVEPGPRGSIPSDAPEGVLLRLEQILAQLAEAEQALPDFAEYERLHDEAIKNLEQLLAEVEAGTIEETGDGSTEPAAA